MRAPLPNGRTLKYQIFRACERFGKDPVDWFFNLSKEDQVDLIVFTNLRDEEENASSDSE